nr:uncharacterized protein LOC106687107 [Halyomorpha halys]
MLKCVHFTFVILTIGTALEVVLTARFACTPDSCNGVECPTVSLDICNAKGMEYRPNSTSCGCCHLCLPYLEDGDECGEASIDTSFDGGPSRLVYHCRSPSTCSQGVCKPNATNC